MNDSDSEVKPNARQHLADRIAELERLLLQAKLDYNDLAPIAALPAEIMATIFQFSVEKDDRMDFRFSSSPEKSSVLERFNFSHVSSTWRHIALNTPTLWCNLFDYTTQWLALLAQRSKTADLTVALKLKTTSSNSIQGVANFLQEHSHRIQDLRLRGPGENLSISLANLTVAPRLRELTVIAEDSITLPLSFLSQVNGLDCLHMEKCGLRWTSSFIRGLTRLCICHPPSQPSWVDFLGALSQTPELECLELRFALPTSSDSDSVPALGTPIILEYLEEINIRSPFQSVTTFTSLFSAPNAQEVDLVLYRLEGSDLFATTTGIGFLSEFLSKMLVHHKKYSEFYKVIFFNCPQNQDFHIQGWRHIPDRGSMKQLGPTDLSVYIEIVQPDSYEDFLGCILSSINLRRTKYLMLETDMPHSALAETFGRLPSIRYIYLSFTCNAFLEALVVSWERSSSGDLLFPSLKSIELEEIEFNEDRADRDHVTMENFLRCLRVRAWVHGIRKLKLVNCQGFNSSMYSQLCAVVPDVEWDEAEDAQD